MQLKFFDKIKFKENYRNKNLVGTLCVGLCLNERVRSSSRFIAVLNYCSWPQCKLHSVCVWMLMDKVQATTANIRVSSVPSLYCAPVFIAAWKAWLCYLRVLTNISFQIWNFTVLAIFGDCYSLSWSRDISEFSWRNEKNITHMFWPNSKHNATDLWDQCLHCSDTWLTT